MLIGLVHTPSSFPAALLVAAVLYLISRPIIRHTAAVEGSPWLARILTISLFLHLLASPAQIFVVDHFYHGVADWLRYDTQGAILGPQFRHFNFSLADANVRGIVNDGSVSISAGIVMAIVGVNQLGAFLVFSWLSFLGTVMFYRAFTTTFPNARPGHRRYAYLLFFFPSLIFWTADVSKEAIMLLSLGLCAFGIAKVLARRTGGFSLLTGGVALGIFIRPNELLILLAGFAVALMVRPAARGERRGGVKRLAGLVFMAALLVLSIVFTVKYLHTTGTSSLENTAANNSGTSDVSGGFGSSNIGYSSSPTYYWHDIYTILFDPMVYNAHGFGQLIAALENTLILGVIVASWRHLRYAVRAAFARPYVMMCAIYSLLFLYAFAALGNLGLITRERTLLFPFMLVLLCIPRTPKHRRPIYEWEYRRKDRKRLRAAPPPLPPGAARRRAPRSDPRSPAPVPVAVAADRAAVIPGGGGGARSAPATRGPPPPG